MPSGGQTGPTASGEVESVLAHFKQQLRQHGSAPQDLSVSRAIDAYREYPSIERLRDIKPPHIQDYKRRRSGGAIAEEKTAEDQEREAQFRSDFARNPTRPTMEANAKYGWLGRHSVHSRVSARTVNYELRCLFTFFRWSIKRNHLIVDPVANIEKFRMIATLSSRPPWTGFSGP